MTDRFQCVQVESAFSPFLPVQWGLPQGSILGPLLFLIFINELPSIIENSENENEDATIVVFADDNTPMQSSDSIEELEEKLQVKADVITEWFGKNEMVVSGDKTKLLLVKTNAAKNNLEGKVITLHSQP